MHVPGVIKRHPARTAVIAAVGLAALVFGFLWFRPDRLFTEDRVSEALPGVSEQSATEVDESQPADAGPTTVAEGEFISLEHDSMGQALIVETADGRRFLRFEDFETSNGPDLVVYLSAKTPAGTDDWHGYDQDFVDLGVLKGNVGNQNYELPADTDLDRYPTAVVWCRRFEVGFAAASLE